MHPQLEGMADRMRNLGLGALQHALRLSMYGPHQNHYAGDLSVLNAAHAAEILIKARIAEDDPLRIFRKVPKSKQAVDLDLGDLAVGGETVGYAKLPDLLLEATGAELPDRPLYESFGKLRNAIQHFAPPDESPHVETLKFVFGVLDRFINQEWGLFAIDFNEEYGDHYEDVLGPLAAHDIRLLVSPHAARAWTDSRYPSTEASAEYREWFSHAVTAALVDPG